MDKGLVKGTVVPQEYTDLVSPHVESMNYFYTDGMRTVVENLAPVEVTHPATKQTYRFFFSDVVLQQPVKEDMPATMDNRLMPHECREMGTTYKGPLYIKLKWERIDGGAAGEIEKRLGGLPIMTRTRMCHLHNMNRQQLIAAKEEGNEMGGYFLCNGLERIIRCLIAQRRHYIMALRRGAYRKRGANYTECATLFRCVRPDQSSATVRCHYLTDGTVNFAFTMRKAEYFIPAGLLLKCFLEVSDRELYDKIVAAAPPGSGHAAFVAERAELLLQVPARMNLRTRVQCLEYLGSHFRVLLDMPRSTPPLVVAATLLRDYVFIHLDETRPADKLALLLQMLHKLYALVNSACCDDNADAVTHHEILLPGHLMCKFFKEKLEDTLDMFKGLLRKDLGLDTPPLAPGATAPSAAERAAAAASVNLEDSNYLKKVADKLPDVGRKVEYLLNTGNLVSKSGLDLSQTSGFTVVAEKLNWFRYLSHFRSVHRGAYFAEIRTTTVRKLLPESWGFFCPVHTPDGSPCGLLNHFAAHTKVVTVDQPEPYRLEAALLKVLSSLGMMPSSPALVPPGPPTHLSVMMDGRLVGYVSATQAHPLVSRLRAIKAAKCEYELMGLKGRLQGLTDEETALPYHLEVVHIPYLLGGVYPGIFLFTQAARMIRPTRHINTREVEMIGTLEQSNMAIKCPDGGVGGSPNLAFTHEEMSAMSMLSVVASMTPYSDYNQSPRNMYQCQMAKQTMGTPAQALQYRTDTKLYRIQTPQTPLARTSKYDRYHMDEYPSGTNAVVAVLAYTGYDMEDAMILNKSSVERGMFHATLYKTEQVDLREEKGSAKVFAAEPLDKFSKGKPFVRPVGAFGQKYPQNVPSPASSDSIRRHGITPQSDNKNFDHIGPDGLPHAGGIVWPGQAVYTTKDVTSGRYKSHNLKGEELAYVDQVTLVGTKEKGAMQFANIRLRMNRNPTIGDKFASRAGQKGVLSIQWPDVNFPYCASTGIRPDLIINPHAFPSRMTIGMLIESMGSKAGALTGQFVDASPFQASDGKPGNPAAHFGKVLESLGYAKHGQETMISGITGEEMPCDIYIGLVYYQRLRHMVSDKFQVRSTGPINQLTHQPVKGRKFGGGIRFGEMERDSLIAHGAAYLLHDRLHSCSDYHVLDVCTKCGSLLSPLTKPHAASTAFQGPMSITQSSADAGRVCCPVCDDSSQYIERVAVPYVFKYLATELAAMNIKMVVETK